MSTINGVKGQMFSRLSPLKRSVANHTAEVFKAGEIQERLEVGKGWLRLQVAKMVIGEAMARKYSPDQEIDFSEFSMLLLNLAGNNSQNPEILAMGIFNLGIVFGTQNMMDNAEKCYRSSLKLDQTNAVGWSNLGGILANNNELDEAEECCRKSVELKPKNFTALYNLGNVYANQNNKDEAERCYISALELAPGPQAESYVWFNLGAINARRNNVDEAGKCFEKALALNPNDPEIRRTVSSFNYVFYGYRSI